MQYEANIYSTSGQNPTIANSDSSRANLALCFSGGGSRALTCAWGQMLGIKTLNLDKSARYISSVSGGTWASSIYTFLPLLPHRISDEDLLGTYHPPADLSLSGDKGTFDINDLGEYSLGQAPAGMGLLDLLLSVAIFLLFHKKSHHKWLWASIVAKHVLEPFELRDKGRKEWSSEKYYSLSLDYAKRAFPHKAPKKNEFFFARPGRPFLVMNDNIMEIITANAEIIAANANVVLLPNQATAVSTGAQGQTPDQPPDQKIVGGGSVETYGYNSTLEKGPASASPVDVKISQPYSLIDSVSTSSAFFAEYLAQHFVDNIKDKKKRAALVRRIADELTDKQKGFLVGKIKGSIEDSIETHIEDFLLETLIDIEDSVLETLIEDSLLKFMDEEFFDFADVVPTYNYWPIGDPSGNTITRYTDGGNLDNIGVIGMLAQSDTGSSSADEIYLVVFDNTSTPLEKKDGNIIAGGQAAPLFGIDFDQQTGVCKPFTSDQQDPENSAFEAKSLIHVFDNSVNSSGPTPFENLVNGLYAANCGTDDLVNTAPAIYQMSLTTVANPLANITGGRKVNVLYIQNAKMLNWQKKIGDPNLKDDIDKGQKSLDPFADFANFPYYSTFTKIELKAKESNALSQMSAWALVDPTSQLNGVFTKFISTAQGA